MAKTDENCISIYLFYAKSLDMFRSFYALSLEKNSKALKDEECLMFIKYEFERWKEILLYE